MSDEEMANAPADVQLLPVTAGKIVLAYNLPGGPSKLKLSRGGVRPDIPGRNNQRE